MAETKLQVFLLMSFKNVQMTRNYMHVFMFP